MIEVFSKNLWKKIWLVFGITFLFIGVFMLFFAPMLASIVGTKPFSDRSRAMISYFWVWMIIYNGIGSFFLYKDMEKYEILIILGIPAGIIFSMMQVIYLVIGLFELVFTEILWGILPLFWSVINILYLFDKKKKERN